MSNLIEDVVREFRRHKSLADRAMAHLDDQDFVCRPQAHVNPIALIVKHLSGNLRSRWTDFLTSDGNKPQRDRDGEFLLTDQDTRANLLASWEHGWQAVFDTLATLKDVDLAKAVTIRGETHTARQALLRGLTHAAYHTGQIMYLARLLKPDAPWITIPPGTSATHPASYLKSG